MSQPTVRPRTDADLTETADVLVRVHDSDGYPVEGVTDPEAWLQSDNLLVAFVAELDGRIIGHIAITSPTESDAAAQLYTPQRGEAPAMLGRLFVAPDARRCGAAQQLMHRATQFANAHRLRLLLDVMTKDQAAIQLYESLGWTKLATVDHDAGGGRSVPAVAMASLSLYHP